MAAAKAKIVLLPTPGAGHIMSMVEMARLLLRHHPARSQSRFSATILVPGPTSAPAVDAHIQSVAASGLDIDFSELPPVDPPTDYDASQDYISVVMERHKPHLRTALSAAAPVAALIIDFFATTAIDVADDLGIPCYLYMTSGAAFLALMLHLPTLHLKFPMEFEEMEGKEMIQVPGVCSFPPLAMPTPMMEKKKKTYHWFVYHGQRFCDVRGIIINTFAELQPTTLRAVEEGRCVPDRPTPPLFPIGPLTATEGYGSGKRHECLEWLDGQPAASVVFLCFGSRGCFEAPQVAAMAVGLERSGHRFLWALRVASPEAELKAAKPMDADLDEVLPAGFLERTKERGKVWPSWAPQAAVLAHPAVGGFVTHCGWNSCLESLCAGVPLLGWPLYAEQHLNAVTMDEDMGVALQLKVDRNNGNFVSAKELERGVRRLMGKEGERARRKANEMMVESKKTWEEGGASFSYMERLVKELLADGGGNHHHAMNGAGKN